MNEVLENIMIFINENTNILIGICIFLIFVLIGYLIDNSVKSKRVRKNIKNTAQVPENINETIKDKEKDAKKNVDEIKHEPTKEEFEEALSNSNHNYITDLILDNNQNNNIDINDDNVETNDELNLDVPNSSNNFDDILNTINSINSLNSDIKLPKEGSINSNNKVDVLYKNDKKLSEILFSDINNKENPDDLDIFQDNIKIGDNIFDENKEKNPVLEPINVDSKVEVELRENELDKIMKKLNNISNLDDDDNYTNIF